MEQQLTGPSCLLVFAAVGAQVEATLFFLFEASYKGTHVEDEGDDDDEDEGEEEGDDRDTSKVRNC